jgi:predicted PurR-regulated permease PerM
MRPTKIEITYKTIIFTLLLLLAIRFIYLISNVLLALFIAVIIMSALNPIISKLEKFRIPRVLSILIIFVLIILALSIMIAAIIPPFVNQTKSLIEQIPQIMNNYGIPALDQQVISDQFGSLPGNIAKFIVNIFSNILAVFTVLILSFYLLAERAQLHRYLIAFFGNEKAEQSAEQFINTIEQQIGGWVRGQIALMVIIGIMSYIGLVVLNVNFALPLSIIAGLLEIIPGIGPTVATIPAVIMAMGTSPITAVSTIALYVIIQQLENNIIVPKVMQKAVGVQPIVTILSIMIGLQIAGVLGAILAVPSVLIIKIIIQYITKTSSLYQKKQVNE